MSDKPSWYEVPDWVQYIAQDFDGIWFGYDTKPETLKVQWGMENDGFPNVFGKCILLERGMQNVNWRSTLEKRP